MTSSLCRYYKPFVYTYSSKNDAPNDHKCNNITFFFREGPRSRFYRRTAALRLIVQPCDEDEEKDDQFFLFFPSNGAPVE
jgi:hypothetical protein